MNNLPIIDWKLGKSLAGGSEAMAKELLEMLIDALPEHETEILIAHSENNLDQLRKAVHKLHGAACYCSTPQLKQAAADLESALKIGQTDKTNALLKDLQQAIKNVMKAR